MTKNINRSIVLMIAFILQSVICEELKIESPNECDVCGMSRQEFSFSRVLLILNDSSKKGACCIDCAFKIISQNSENIKEIEAADYKSCKLIDAKKAVWVIGGSRHGVMSQTAKWAFLNKIDADAYIKAYGGSITTFTEILDSIKNGTANNKCHMHGQNAAAASGTQLKDAECKGKCVGEGKKCHNGQTGDATHSCSMHQSQTTNLNENHGAKKCPMMSSPASSSGQNCAMKCSMMSSSGTSSEQSGVKKCLMMSSSGSPREQGGSVKNCPMMNSSTSSNSDTNIGIPTEKDKCPVCGMFVLKYPDFLTIVHLNNGKVLFFDGPKDFFKFYLRIFKSKITVENITSIYITDYYKQEPINAKEAYYVKGSNIFGPMGKELIPFTSETDASEFKKDHNGSVILKFSDIKVDIIKDLD